MHKLMSRGICLFTLVAFAGCQSAETQTDARAETEPSANITNSRSAAPWQPTGGPLDALQPKKETGVTRFLESYPESDGRGVVVAIFDTGVDPGAPGLQTTTDGKPKIIDVVDGSGSGDVDMTTKVQLGDDGTFEGLSGRELTPHPDWNNPTGEYRVGLKPIRELYPRGLDGRMAGERRKEWDRTQRRRNEALLRELAAFDREHPEPTKEELEIREDIQARIEQLEKMQSDYRDEGGVLDCVVFHDGEKWRAALDTDFDGEFGDETTLTNFRDERQYATMGEVDLLNYVLNIYGEGDVLSIVADAGAHGTHVAGIVAAHFPDQPELNGMAPGAQIVSVKIGDTRLGSSSVGTGTTRGYRTVLDNECDLINMSYGGADAFPDNRYRSGQLASEIVNKHNVIFVSSASNDGPALSTVGAPGGSTSALIGVGASISPEMMKAQYALRTTEAGQMQYPWSSRGPTLDGDLGVDITAPGGAISSVPNWTLQKNMLMNGTSMSSPSACGAIALMLSKLKQDDVDYTPHSVKRALKATAVEVPEQSPWAQGAGMLQVDSAYEHLVNYEADEQFDVWFDIKGPDNERGAYLREPYENNQPTEQRITIRPNFHEDALSRKKVDFETRLRLESSEPWVEVTDFLSIASGGDTTDIRIDPTGLGAGAHFAQVTAYDADRPERGPLCTYPVTVIKGEELTDTENAIWRERVSSKPGDLNRWFFEVPEGSGWMDLIIRRVDDDTSRLLVVQALQLVDDKPNNHRKFSQWVRFDDQDEQIYTLPVDGGRTLEIVCAQNWSSLGTGEFDFEVRFRGLRPEPSQLFIDGSSLVTRFDIHSPMRDSVVSPKGSLTGLIRSFRPTDSKIRALDPERDRLFDDRLTYEIVKTFEFEVPADLGVNVNPSVSMVPHAWEIYESFLWYIFDEDGGLVEANAGEDVDLSLDEGTYTLKLHVRHDDTSMLERIENAPLMMRFNLPSAVGLKFASDPEDAFAGRGGFGSPEIEEGSSMVCYVATPTNDSLPDIVKPGDVLVGSFTVGGEAELLGTSTRPGGWPVMMSVIDKPNERPEIEAKDDDETETAEAEEKSKLDELEEEVAKLRVAKLDDLMAEEDAEAFETLAAEILEDDPDNLEVRLKQMERAQKLENNEEAIAKAEAVLNELDTDEIAAYFGRHHDEDAEDYDEDLAERMKKEKAALIQSLRTIAEARGELASADDEASVEAFEDAIRDLQVWATLDDEEGFEIRLRREMLNERYGQALAMLDEKLADEPERDLYERRIEVLQKLGWDEWAAHEERRMLTRYPKHTTLF